MKTIYTAHATNTGGRSGRSESSDGNLKVNLGPADPAKAKPGATNPEQLFAAGYAACFGSALEAVAKKQGVDGSGATVTANIDLNQDEAGYSLGATLEITLPNVQGEAAQKLVEATHQFCPYSKATKGNIEVKFIVNEHPIQHAA